MKGILLSAAALLVSSSALAVEDTWYAKASYGLVDFDTASFERDLCRDEGICYNFDRANAFSLNAGYRLNRHFSFEAGYTDLGRTSDSAAVDIFGETVNFRTALSGRTATIAALASTDASQPLSAGAKLGVHFWKAKGRIRSSAAGMGFGESFSDDGTDVFYGVFANWRIDQRWTLGVDYTFFEMDEADPSMASLSLAMDF